MRNNTDTQYAFAGIAFDITSETDVDSIGAAILATADNTTAANHDANILFATNDAGDDGLTERMRIDEEGDVTIAGGSLSLPSTEKLYLDGGGSTYITESAGDLIDIYSGGVLMLRIEESGTDSVFTMDNVRLGVGSSKDMVMYHDGTNSYIDRDVGSVNIRNILTDADRGKIIIKYDGSGTVGGVTIVTLTELWSKA